MSQWIIQIEPTADGRFQWRHVPAEGTGTGTPHVGGDHFDTPEEARKAGEEALARHHETALKGSSATGGDGAPQTPVHGEETRLDESQAQLETQEDPRLSGDSPLSISSLPLEAEVRAADEEGSGLSRH